VLSSVEALTFSITDVVRRLLIIISSVIMFQNEIPTMNFVGISVALLGASLYNVSRNDRAVISIDAFMKKWIQRCLFRRSKEKEESVVT